MAGSNPTATYSAQTQIAEQAGNAVLNAIPIPGLGAVAQAIESIFGAAHAQAVKVEAQTLASAVPQWRALLSAIAAAYNSGEISASQAVSYVEEAKGIYYTQVKPIQKGDPGTGVGASAYYAQHGRFAPISPCNAACNIAYYHVEPEAQLVEQAISSGQAQTVDLLEIPILNLAGSAGVPPSQLAISPPVLSSSVPGGTAVNSVAAQAKNNPLVFGAIAVIGLVLLFKVIE
jgi:hypothetical protein